jgi:hypothetical protein
MLTGFLVLLDSDECGETGMQWSPSFISSETCEQGIKNHMVPCWHCIKHDRPSSRIRVTR